MPDLPASPSDAFQTPRQQLSQSREVHLLSGRLAGCSCAWAGAGHATTAPTTPGPCTVWGLGSEAGYTNPVPGHVARRVDIYPAP